MHTDRERYATVARQRKTDFIITAVIFAIMIAAAIAAIILLHDNAMAFLVCAVCLVWILFSFFKSLKKLPPLKVIFSKDLEGEIVEVHVNDAPAVSGVPRGLKTRLRPNSGTSSASVARRLKGELYVKTADGSIKYIAGLNKEATEVYTEGDRVLRVAGTQYPIILNRETRIIPCPICGTVHAAHEIKCPHCKV